jgi:hypothetical protein
MDTNYAIANFGRAVGSFLLSWVSFSLIAQWTKTPVYDSNGNVMWGNTAWLIFLATLISWVIIIAIEFIVYLFMGWGTTKA